MSQPEMMPIEPILKERWRGEAILKWMEADPVLRDFVVLSECVADEATALAALKPGATYNDFAFAVSSPVNERYLVVKYATYRPDDDGEAEYELFDWESCRTLEEAQTEVEDRVFEPTRPNYTNCARVFDTHLRREIEYSLVQKIEWTL